MANSKIRTLIIDDDEFHNFVLMQRIKQANLPVSCSAVLNGKKALQKLETSDKKGHRHFPQIILLDLDMPVMNGFEFLDEYEKIYFPIYPNVQLYMVSSSINVNDRSKAKTYASVKNFITKPLPLPALEEIVKFHQLTYNQEEIS